jgi:early secretory antigenic target protein ESAT-6
VTHRFTGLLVDHGALDQAHADITAAVNAIDERLHALETQLAPLRSDWSGQAREAYAVSKARWDTAMTEMKAVLAEVGVSVARSNAEYAGADQASAATFGQI